MSYQVYILCDSDYARGYSIANYHVPNASTLMIPSTPYREHEALISNLMDTSGWAGKQFVGIMSWRANKRMVIPNFQQLVDHALATDSDVIALCPSPHPHPHPHFATMWELLCSQLGYTKSQYESSEIPMFLHNDWLASPTWMLRYIQHIQEAHAIMETPEYRTQLRMRPHVAGNRVTYLEPADILERLPCLFFWAHGASLHLSPSSL